MCLALVRHSVCAGTPHIQGEVTGPTHSPTGAWPSPEHAAGLSCSGPPVTLQHETVLIATELMTKPRSRRVT